MMGHTIDIYHVVQMNTIEYLHNVYGASGLAITPNMQTSKIDALKEIISAWGLNPEEDLTRKAISKPHRTTVAPQDLENNQIKIICDALKTEIKRELRST
jgi:hypothetical protein